MKRSVRDLFRMKKLGNFPVVQEDATVKDALLAFKSFDSDAVLVKRGYKLVGLYSERDLISSLSETLGGFSLDSKITDVMTRKIVYVTPAYQLGECLAVMSSMNIGVLLVMQHGRPLGILSMKQIMEALIDDQEFMIGQLVQYVTGSHMQTPVTAPSAVVKTHFHQGV